MDVILQFRITKKDAMCKLKLGHEAVCFGKCCTASCYFLKNKQNSRILDILYNVRT